MNTEITANPLLLQPLRPGELANADQASASWLWQGYLAPGKLSALISPPKSGKTTLLSHLLARLEQGGKLAGLSIAPGRAVVVSEEATADWDARCRRLAIGPNIRFVCRPFQGARPREEQWFALIAGLESLHRQEPIDLVVLDALAALLPGYAETCGPKLLDCLMPVQALAAQGPAVWLLHHPAKGRRADGQAARGSGALLGFADIVMEMSCCRRARSRDRRRRICAYSRYIETPRNLIIELADDGSDYLVRTDEAGIPLVGAWPALEELLSGAMEKLTLQDILSRWPADTDTPNRTTLTRWLKRAANQGLVCRSGAGANGDAYRYWLHGREPFMFPGQVNAEELRAWKERCAAEVREKLLAAISEDPGGHSG